MELKHKETEVLKEIRELQKEIKNLQFHSSYQAILNGKVIKGCSICTRSRAMTIALGYRCNLDCPFCFADSYIAPCLKEDEKYNRSVCLKYFYRNKEK